MDPADPSGKFGIGATGPEWRHWAAQDIYTGRTWGPTRSGETYNRDTLNFGASLTRFADKILGADHEFKFGLDYTKGNIKDQLPGIPYMKYYYNGLPWAYYDRAPYYWGYFTLRTGERQLGDMPRYYGFWKWSAFLQDSIKVGRLVLNLGIRYDEGHASIEEDFYKAWYDEDYDGLANILLPDLLPLNDQRAPGIKDLVNYKIFAPRIGATYDLFGTGKTVLKASFARYGEVLLGQNVSGLHSFTPRTVRITWYDDNQNGVFDHPPVDRYVVGSYSQYNPDKEQLRRSISPDLSSPYFDEFVAAVSHELAKDFSLSLSFTYKEGKNLVARNNLVNPRDSNMWVPYTVKDPGADGDFGTGDDQDLTAYMLRKEAQPDFYQKQNIEDATKKYWGLELVLFRRMTKNWQFSGAVTYSKQYGNYSAGYLSFSGTTNWCDPNGFVNRYGRLENDRPIIVKLMSTVVLPYDIRVSGYYRYFSGSPYQRNVTVYFPAALDGSAPKSSSQIVAAEPNGTRRNPVEQIMDLRIEKDFKVGPGKLNFMVDVFNLFGYYRITIDNNPGGYIYQNGSYAPYPTYGTILTVEGSRVLQLALRYNF
jgi:hypothetical protein